MVQLIFSEHGRVYAYPKDLFSDFISQGEPIRQDIKENFEVYRNSFAETIHFDVVLDVELNELEELKTEVWTARDVFVQMQ